MSKRYEWINGETYCDSDQMYDNETGNKTQPVYVADLLNEQDQKIKELEHRLAKCIEPKFKIGQIVWVSHKELDGVVKTEIESIDIEIEEDVTDITYYDIDGIGFDANDLFATEEEAKAKLREMQDGSICD